jgi:hypothetical protein
MRMFDPAAVSIGYLLPTRDAVTLERVRSIPHDDLKELS